MQPGARGNDSVALQKGAVNHNLPPRSVSHGACGTRDYPRVVAQCLPLPAADAETPVLQRTRELSGFNRCPEAPFSANLNVGAPSARCYSLSVAFLKGRNRPWCLPFDLLSLAPTAVGLDD
jgi:hypothetical protein